MIPRRSPERSNAEVPLGVESAFPNMAEPRLAKPGEPRSRRNLLARALTWLRPARRTT
jgi:hypothetical protein